MTKELGVIPGQDQPSVRGHGTLPAPSVWPTLAERVRKAAGPDRRIDRDLTLICGQLAKPASAVTSDVGAAIRFCTRMLPDGRWSTSGGDSSRPFACIMFADQNEEYEASHLTPALALLLATMRALAGRFPATPALDDGAARATSVQRRMNKEAQPSASTVHAKITGQQP